MKKRSQDETKITRMDTNVKNKVSLLLNIAYHLKPDLCLPKNVVIENSLKIMENVFYSNLKTLFVLKIFKFLS